MILDGDRMIDEVDQYLALHDPRTIYVERRWSHELRQWAEEHDYEIVSPISLMSYGAAAAQLRPRR